MRLAILLLPGVLAGCLVDFKTTRGGLLGGGGAPAGAHPTAQARPGQPGRAAPRATAASSIPKTGRMRGVAYQDIDDKIVAEAEGFVAACFADYDDLRARWAPYEQKHRARFAEIQRLPSYYAQRDALTALATAYYADLKAAKLDVAGATWFMLVGGGLAYEIDAYLAGLHRKRGISQSTKLFRAAFPPADDEVLADAYCVRAAIEGTHRMRDKSWLSVRDMLPAPRARAAAAYLDGREARIAKELAPAPHPKKHYTTHSLETWLAHNMEIEVGAQLDVGAQVAAVTKTSSGVRLRATQTGSVTRQHDCVETKQVDRIDANGRVRYRETCQFSSSKSVISFELDLVDAPADLRPGDWVDFVGIVTKMTTGKVDRKTGSPTTIRFDLDGRLIRKVARGKRPGDRPDQYLVLASY